MRKSTPTTSLQASLDQYLALRRALGVKLRLPGRLLQRFVDFADAAGVTYITTDLALAWATQPANVQPAQWANRLGMVRRFAQYCSASDPRTIVPSPDLLPYQLQRPEPYIYRDEDIGRLLAQARQLPSATGLRPVCDRIPMQRYSAYMLPPVCEPMKPCIWIATMSISSMAC